MSALQWLERQAWIDALGWTLVHSLWQGVAIAMVMAIIMRSMRTKSAGARYVVAISMLLMILGCAIGTFGLLNREAVSVTAGAQETAPMLVTVPAHSIAIPAPVSVIQ